MSSSASAQLLGITGANHPELNWKEFETDHFVLVYHQGLDSIVRLAAPIAEEVYRVVTTNLQTPLPGKIRIYFSDNDEERNAFTFGDKYIFIWMRGILDDNLFSLRSSGTSKWLRSVITHEFTHITIAYATRTWTDALFPAIDDKVPRWFNEGMARYMEPDGWTDDLDIPLRVAAVSSKLDLGSDDDFLSGTLLYEGGQSLVRYIAATYGDSALVKILRHREKGLFPYHFEDAVRAATKHSLEEIYQEWHKILNVYYNTEYGQKEDIEDIARKIPTHLAIVEAVRLAPDGKHIAILGKRTEEEGTKLFVIANDTGAEPKLLTGEPGIEPYLTWSPDGKYLLFSQIRFGHHGDLVYDLYRCDARTGERERIPSDERLEYPDFSPDGKTIVAAQFFRSGSDLVLLDANGSNLRTLTDFNDENVQVYSPRWSPDGKRIAFSIFRKNGMRDIAVVDTGQAGRTAPRVKFLTNDFINDRYPIWSPREDSIVFLSFKNGVPNLYLNPLAQQGEGVGGEAYARQLTDVASNVLAWDISKDSILITSFTDRNSVQLFWLPSHRSVVPSIAAQPVERKYTAWRSIRWPIVTRTADSLPSAIVTGPYAYNSLAHIHPLLYLPIVGTDISSTGAEGAQLGAFAFLADEMQKHLLQAFAWYGDASKTVSYGAEYENNQLLPTISMGGANELQFRDVIQDVAYYEHSKSLNLGLTFTLHTPNSLLDLHNIFIGGEWNDIQPWNPSQFVGVDSNQRPTAARMLDLGVLYSYLSPLFQVGVAALHSDKSLASTITRTQLRASLHKEFAFGEDIHNELAILLHGAADVGDELPQDVLGFYKYDAFEGGFNAASLHERDRLRGIRRYYYGNRLLSGSIEIREADRLFSSIVPLLKTFEPQLVEFFDMGTTWYANAPTNNPSAIVTPLSKTEWLKTGGVELRSELAFDEAIEGGVGWELVKTAQPDWFIRFTGIF
ncbi:MAG TPA: hypothetical protein VFD13_05390 [Candidatus Kapabacteria bacterium]|nr:hypothetical protein [Candidatus Kapabacteria bacterium]